MIYISFTYIVYIRYFLDYIHGKEVQSSKRRLQRDEIIWPPHQYIEEKNTTNNKENQILNEHLPFGPFV